MQDRSVATDFSVKLVAIDVNRRIVYSDLESDDKSKFDEDSLCDAYKSMYSHWIRACEKNRALVSEKTVLLDFKEKAEKRLWVFKTSVTEKKKKKE